jgi:hypothetical protein
MNSRANVINRVALTVLGLLLVAAGGLGLAVGVDALGAWQATDPVLRQEVSTFPDEHRWFWWVVSGALLLIAVLALLWLLAQLKTDRTTRLDLTTNAREGYTTLYTSALTDAVEDEALAIAGVTSVSANVREHRGRHIYLRVGLAESATIAEVRTRLENEVVTHLRAGVGDPRCSVTIELRPGASRTPQRSGT